MNESEIQAEAAENGVAQPDTEVVENKVVKPGEAAAHAAFIDLKNEANKLIIGQERLMERLLIALLSNGHLLV